MYRAFGSVQRLLLCRPLLALAAVLGCGCLATAQLAPADRQERFIGPSVRLLQWGQAAGPQQLAALEVDTANPVIQMGVSYGDGQTLSLVPISRQAERYTRPERYAIAGVNGDFFFYPSRTEPGIPTSATVGRRGDPHAVHALLHAPPRGPGACYPDPQGKRQGNIPRRGDRKSLGG